MGSRPVLVCEDEERRLAELAHHGHFLSLSLCGSCASPGFARHKDKTGKEMGESLAFTKTYERHEPVNAMCSRAFGRVLFSFFILGEESRRQPKTKENRDQRPKAHHSQASLVAQRRGMVVFSSHSVWLRLWHQTLDEKTNTSHNTKLWAATGRWCSQGSSSVSGARRAETDDPWARYARRGRFLS